jgi:hypothetical protein
VPKAVPLSDQAFFPSRANAYHNCCARGQMSKEELRKRFERDPRERAALELGFSSFGQGED